jgi:hypothetical protein
MQYQYEDVATELYQGDPPAFIWKALEQLYHSSFCSESHLKVTKSVNQHTHSWVSRKAGVIDAVLLYQIKNHRAVVLNELVAVSNTHIDSFSAFIFKKYHAVKIIQFKALFQQEAEWLFPFQAYIFSEDFILTLPKSTDSWLQSLSKKTRATLRSLITRCQRLGQNFSFRCIQRHEITPLLVKKILLLSRLRMQNKGKAFGLSAREEQYLILEMCERGVVYVLENEEKIIAGLLCTYCNKDLFFHIIAHDSTFDNLRVGRLCCYYSIVSAIENKYERLHFLWGRYSYKLQFGAQEKKLIKLTIFRKSFYKFQFPACYIQKFLHQLKRCLSSVKIRFIRWKYLLMAKYAS